jgi:hypothetical protein
MDEIPVAKRAMVWMPNEIIMVERRRGVRNRCMWMKMILLAMKTVRAIRDFAQRYAGVAGWPEAPNAMIISFGIQTIALLATAILIQLEVITPKPEDPREDDIACNEDG